MTTQPFYPFRSEHAKADFEALCRERAKAWPPGSETMTIETVSGRTFVRACGRSTYPPLVLLPGARAGSLMWTHHVAALSAHYRIYALDIIGEVGFSVNHHEISKPDDLVNWLDEVLTALVPAGQLSLMGISYGGWIAGQYALRHPGRLRKIVLLAPGGTVLPLSLAFSIRIGLLLMPLPGRSGTPLRRMLTWLFRDTVRTSDASRALFEETVADMQKIWHLFALPRPLWSTVLDDQAWQSFGVPCLFLVGENEKIYSAQAAVRRLNRVAPQVRTEIVPNAGHDLTIVQADLVVRKVLEFLGEPAEAAARAA
jgi:pimeloyl-ACP methyl ester carboxylesterase